MVGCGRKRSATDGTLFCGRIPKNLGFQRLPLWGIQQNMAKVFAIDGTGHALDTNTFLAVIQQQTITTIVVTTNCPDKPHGLLPLLWCHAWQSAVRLAFNG